VVNLSLALVLFKYFFTLGQADLLTSAALSGQNVSGLPMTTHSQADLKRLASIDYNEASSLWPELGASAIKIFKTADIVNSKLIEQFDGLYDLNRPLAIAWSITSDGWLVSSYDLVNWSELVAVADNHKTYKISQKAVDPMTDLIFYRLEGASNLVSIKLGENGWSRPGQLFYNLDGRGSFQAVWLQKINNDEEQLVINSDSLRQRWEFSKTLPNSVIFKGRGELFGLVNSQNKFVPVNYIKSGLTSLLAKGNFKRIIFGLEYIDLNRLSADRYGLLVKNIIKDSSADKAGIKVGDILLSIDEINLNGEASINEILQNYRMNSRASLIVQRSGQNRQLDCHFNY
jgi:hypothetical protein